MGMFRRLMRRFLNITTVSVNKSKHWDVTYISGKIAIFQCGEEFRECRSPLYRYHGRIFGSNDIYVRCYRCGGEVRVAVFGNYQTISKWKNHVGYVRPTRTVKDKNKG